MNAATRNRLLCMVPNWIGDAVLCLPALQLLADSGATLQLLGRPNVRRVLEAIDGACEWVDMPSERWRRLALAYRLRHRPANAAALFTPSFSAALFAWVAGVPVRCGESADARAVLLSHPLPRIDRHRHLALSYQEIAETCLAALSLPAAAADGLQEPVVPEGLRQWPRLRVRDDERRAIEALPPEVRDAIVVAPGARYGPSKRYPPERFAQAAEELARLWQRRVVVVGAREDAAETAAVAGQCRDGIDLAGCTDLSQLLAVLSDARVVLSNDSGTMHLAAALGRPVVGVFGSTNPGWTAPLGPHVAALSHAVFCWPCYARHCREDFACMLGQPAEKLVAAARRLVENAEP
jgi:heptosyltransferase-2